MRNVVLIVTDDQEAGSLGVMRKLVARPGGDWVRFTGAYANTSLCCPARATLLTGQFAHRHGVTGNRDGADLDDSDTLPVWLNDAGYRTGLFGKYLNGWPFVGRTSPPPGWDVFKTGGASADVQFERAIAFMEASDEPFFAYVAPPEPHRPATPRIRPEYAAAPVPIDKLRSNSVEADVSDKPAWVRGLPRRDDSAADAELAERIAAQRALLGVDDGVQRIVDSLTASGRLDDTLIVFVSDNGYSFGSHRHVGKNCVYEESAAVPLMIRYPNAAQRIVHRLVSHVNIAPTIVEWAGVVPTDVVDGRSLVPLLDGSGLGPSSEWSNEVLLEKRETGWPDTSSQFYAIRVIGWVYAEYDNGDRELYDLEADRLQRENLAGRPEHAWRQAALRAQLNALRGLP